MAKIHFKMTMSDGKKVDAVGVPYTTKNGINVALHKRGNFWYATELSTGAAISTSKFNGVRTLNEAKAGVEELSPIVAKVIKQRGQKSRSTNVAKKSGKAAAPRTGANTQSQQAAPKSAPVVIKAAPTAPKRSTTYTVKVGRSTRTFATKAEAQEFANQCRNRNVSITSGTRKPTHRVVRFTAKK